MLLVNNIILLDETCSTVNDRLEVWRKTLKVKRFRLSRPKTKYLACRFNERLYEASVEVWLDTQTITKSDSFK